VILLEDGFVCDEGGGVWFMLEEWRWVGDGGYVTIGFDFDAGGRSDDDRDRLIACEFMRTMISITSVIHMRVGHNMRIQVTYVM
jgi:hypothetical protein